MTAWDAERAEEMQRAAYRYVARIYPEHAHLEPLGIADRADLEAEARQDWSAYVEALRELCRTAKSEARRAA